MLTSAIGRHAPTNPPLDPTVFPVTRRWAYCNSAAVGPLPRVTRDAVVAALDAQMNDACAGILDVEARKDEIRASVASAIGAAAQDIAFMRATSDGALIVATGLDWREGDEVILSANEFGANAHPWLNLRDRGVRCRLVQAPGERISPELLDAIATPHTRVVTVSYVGFLDGYRHDLPAIGAWCRERGIIFAVDAIQGFGYLPLDVQAWNIDVCYFGVAKWLLSPQGLSVVYVRPDLVERFRPALCSWRSVRDPMNFLDYGQELLDGAQRFEGGTANYPAIVGFGASLNLLRVAGFDALERHVLALTGHLIDGARQRGIAVLSDTAPAARSGIVLLDAGDSNASGLLGERAAAARVQVTVRDGGVRVSPHGFNTIDDVDRVLEIFGA